MSGWVVHGDEVRCNRSPLSESGRLASGLVEGMVKEGTEVESRQSISIKASRVPTPSPLRTRWPYRVNEWLLEFNLHSRSLQ